jgi:hypothetical protein
VWIVWTFGSRAMTRKSAGAFALSDFVAESAASGATTRRSAGALALSDFVAASVSSGAMTAGALAPSDFVAASDMKNHLAMASGDESLGRCASLEISHYCSMIERI